MGTGIFLVSADETLIELSPERYDSEELLQRLLERYPSVLAGDQFDPSNPRRWLLISREIGVPGEEGGGGRWSLDHLFLDQDGIPTLIEVKRSTDTRIRREVVGQMLDYAANAVAYWPLEALKAAFEKRCALGSVDPDAELSNFLGPTTDPAIFWQSAKTNLQAGRIRLVFVADEIPAELRRIVEFLNQQMDPAEVLAVEIRQYTGGGLRSLIPRVIGQTEQALQRKSPAAAERRGWNEDSFLLELRSRQGQNEATVAGDILKWARAHGARLSYGKGERSGSVFVVFDQDGVPTWPVALWTYGKLEVQFQFLRDSRAFGDINARRELQRRLNEIPGVAISDDKLEKRPSIPFAILTSPNSLGRLIEVLAWTAERVRAS